MMREQSSLDPHAILASLGITDAQAQPVTGGADTAIWQITWRDARYALRVFRPEQAARFENELAMMAAANAGGIPVPTVVQHSLWQNRPVMLLSWLEGKTLFDQLQTVPQSLYSLGKAFGRMQAAIHAVTAPNVDSTSWIEWAGDEPELKARLYDLPSRKTALIHLDYHPLNVMVNGDQISGVLDWTNARAGNPRADFARTYAILRIQPYGPLDDLPRMGAIRRTLERAWRAGYFEAAGKPEHMALFYAWAGASMIRDLSPRIGRPGFWLRDEHLDIVRAWRDTMKRRAGIA